MYIPYIHEIDNVVDSADNFISLLNSSSRQFSSIVFVVHILFVINWLVWIRYLSRIDLPELFIFLIRSLPFIS